MSLKAIWTGHLKIKMLTVPVRVVGAIDNSEKIGFNRLHKTCSHKSNQKTVCLHCIAAGVEAARDLKPEDLIRGFEHAKGQWVTVSDEEYNSVKIPSNHTIEIKAFRPAAEIDELLLDSSYYLAPNEEKAGFAKGAFATIQQAMAGRVGIGKVALRDREYIIAIRAKGPGLVMHTLHKPNEVRNIERLDEFQYPVQTSAEEVQLASMLIGQMTQPIDLNDLRDEFSDNLRKLVDAKIQGTAYEAPKLDTPQSSI